MELSSGFVGQGVGWGCWGGRGFQSWPRPHAISSWPGVTRTGEVGSVTHSANADLGPLVFFAGLGDREMEDSLVRIWLSHPHWAVGVHCGIIYLCSFKIGLDSVPAGLGACVVTGN